MLFACYIFKRKVPILFHFGEYVQSKVGERFDQAQLIHHDSIGWVGASQWDKLRELASR